MAKDELGGNKCPANISAVCRLQLLLLGITHTAAAESRISSARCRVFHVLERLHDGMANEIILTSLQSEVSAPAR